MIARARKNKSTSLISQTAFNRDMRKRNRRARIDE